MDIHPPVPNPYTLLPSISETNAYFTVSVLKDAFFCIPVDKQSQTIFAIEWENPKMARKVQLCWTVLPQGSRNSPTLFGHVLAKDVQHWQVDSDSVTLLQYVDDVQIGTDTEESCLKARISLLSYLGLARYRESQKKSQVAKEKVRYLGFEVSKGESEPDGKMT